MSFLRSDFRKDELITEIADDIVNIDRAMKWGFAWKMGPFEMLDQIGNNDVIDRCMKEGIKVPKMLKLLNDSGNNTFYNDNQFLDLDGNYKPLEN